MQDQASTFTLSFLKKRLKTHSCMTKYWTLKVRRCTHCRDTNIILQERCWW